MSSLGPLGRGAPLAFASGKLETLLKATTTSFSPPSRPTASGSSRQQRQVRHRLDLARRRQLHRLSGHGGQVKAVAFSNDGKQVVTGAGDGILRLWSAVDGRRTAEMTEHKRRADREDKPLSAGVTTAGLAHRALIASGDTRGRFFCGTAHGSLPADGPGGLIGYADVDRSRSALMATGCHRPIRGCVVAELPRAASFMAVSCVSRSS